VPSSNGLAHRGPLGRDQGGHSERAAGRIGADLLRDVREEGYAGGILFEWMDEWFKHTWNTSDHERPYERRQLWRNVLTNEEFFGVVAAEPGRAPVALPDGRDGEWARNGSWVIAASRGPVRQVRAVEDEAYLHLRLRLARADLWRRAPVSVALDVRPEGNRGLPGLPGVAPEADVAVQVGPGARAKIRRAAWSDPVAFQYGLALPYVAVDRRELEPESGAWVRPRMILNRPYVVPSTGERRAVELADLGTLPWGTANPRDRRHDARVLASARGAVVELRLPWALLGFSDPSSRQVLIPRADGTFGTRTRERVGIAVAAEGGLLRTAGYAWKDWDAVRWHERRKAGWPALRRALAETAARPR
jgi:hypothetical protein